VSFFDQILPWRKKSVSTLDLFREIYGGRMTATGKSINAKKALEVSAVFACLRVIGEGVAQVPFKLYRKNGRTRLEAVDHPLYDVIEAQPNPWQTSFELREMLVWHVGLTGNFFAFKNIVFGKILELIPLHTGVTVLRADDGTLSYEATMLNGTRMLFTADQIWHVRGPTWDSWMGLDAVKYAREAIGLSLSTEEQHARMHKNGVQNSGVYSVEGNLSPQQHKEITGWIEKEVGGLENTGKALVLDRAAKWLNTGMTGVDSQHLETRRYQVEEVCRFFRVMPIMVGHSDKSATYASAEQMFLAHLVHTLAPWYRRIEQSANVSLLTKKERATGFYTKFIAEGMLRGSAKDTKDSILGYVNGGLMTANEGREKLDMNPDADPVSDQLRIPVNVVNEAQAETDSTGVPNANQDA
jgi:HK97 family phage portal protein